MIELKTCGPLRAKLTEASCEYNRKSGRIFSCDTCPGLGAVAVLETREESPVAKELCSVKGCETTAHARGMCWKHERSELGIDPGTGKPLAAKVKKAKKAKKEKPLKVVTSAVAKNIAAHIAAENVTKQVEKVIAHVEKTEYVQVNAVAESVVERPAPALVMSEMDMELDQLFKAKRAAWLYDLANATTIRSRAKMFLSMSDSLEGMVY